MPNVNDLKNSKFLTKEDVEPDTLVVIKNYEEMDVSLEKEPTKMKWVLHFKELDKPMVLNKTNGMLLAAITGSEEFDDWIGKQIVLYNDKSVMFAGEFTGGIRIRAAKELAAPPLRHQTEPDAPEPSDKVTNPDYVGDNPPPPVDDDIPY